MAGQRIHDQSNVVLDFGGKTLGGYIEGGGGRSILLLERCNGVRLTNGQFDQQVGTMPWDEHAHAIRFLNCRDVFWSNLHAINVMGDFIYISHDLPFAHGEGIEGRGTERVVGQHFSAQGKNAGRNMVSIICGRTIRLEDMYAEDVTKPGMPGGIDIEPDWPTEYVEDVGILRANLVTAHPGPLFGMGIANHIAKTRRISAIYAEDVAVRGPFTSGFAYYGPGFDSAAVSLVRPIVAGATNALLELDGGKFAVAGPVFDPVKQDVSHDRRRRRKKKKGHH